MKQTVRQLFALITATVMLLSACKKGDIASNNNETTPTNASADIEALKAAGIPSDFNYATSKNIKLDVSILAPDNTPIKFIPVQIMSKPEEEGGIVLYKGLTDASGKLTGNVQIPAYYTQVTIDPKYLGVIRNAVVSIVNNQVSCTLGGSRGYSGNVIINNGRPSGGNNSMALRLGGAVISYIGTYNSQGKPDYLLPTNDVISATLLANINASLPERQPVPTYHPDYLTATAETNLNVTELSDVWFTFVTEGAGYMNSIGYYTYPTNQPPATVDDIDSIKIILPNASLSGSGGQLVSGNKVYLGRYPANVSIGFVLIANGWNGTGVGNGNWKVFSDDALNPGTTPANKRQTVLLWDDVQQLFLIGFEDILRENSGCDHDFNDCIFFVKSNPVTGISKENVNPMDRPVDTDRDGVNDTYDDFPTDPTRAYINYFPSANSMGTHTFEDNWPYMGDYDLNDLVVDYRYTTISNAQNQVIDLKAQYVLRASGAAFHNGFGVQLPFASSLVQSVSGSLVNNSDVVRLDANGCENGQSKAVIIPFDDAYTAMNTNSHFNTYNGTPYLTRDTITMQMKFTRPITQTELGTAPFNPFIIIDRTRGREAHMPGFAPTDKVNKNYFGTGADQSVPAQNRYYKTAENLPWGINFTEPVDYPAEGRTINTVYLNFVNWARSGGTSNTDWYKDVPNIVTSRLYRH